MDEPSEVGCYRAFTVELQVPDEIGESPTIEVWRNKPVELVCEALRRGAGVGLERALAANTESVGRALIEWFPAARTAGGKENTERPI